VNRNDALGLVQEKVSSPQLRTHMLATEACMAALARRLGQDESLWAQAGLVHDLDMEEVGGDPERHGLVAAETLRGLGFAEEFVHAVAVHTGRGERVSLLDKALWAVDPTTGFIMAAVLVVPSRKLADLQVSSIKKRMKDKRFALAVNRDQIRSCSDLGLELDEFLDICLTAMRAIAADLGF